MKLLNNVSGYIGRKYGTYDKKSVQSYLGNSKGHLFVNFALEDEDIKKILKEYEVANGSRRIELRSLYNSRVDTLINNSDFCIKNIKKHTILPSVEATKDRTPGYLVGMFGKNQEEFEKYGEAIYVPSRYYGDIKVVQHVEKRGERRRVSALYYVPEISDFKFYIATRIRNLDGEYYLEEVSIDYEKRSCNCNSFFLDNYDFNKLILDLKEI